MSSQPKVGRALSVAFAAGVALILAAAILLLRFQPSATIQPTPVGEGTAGPVNENLNAVAWVQTAAEYRAAALQAYALAEARLVEGLTDSNWSASLEQLERGGFAQLPPAVILDLDETVLDNSPYQARLVLDDAEFVSESWNAWVREVRARLVPGVASFVALARDRGVAIFWVTNRAAAVEAATRDNLLALGLPVTDAPDNLLTSGERPEWGSDKGTRRSFVADTHRIVLSIGDNLGDFFSEVNRDQRTRQEMTDLHGTFWGRRWIVLPNPLYGSWDGSLIGFRYDLPVAEKRALKAAALDPDREEAR